MRAGALRAALASGAPGAVDVAGVEAASLDLRTGALRADLSSRFTFTERERM